MSTLYDLTAEIAWFNSIAEEGEIDPQTAKDTFDGLQYEFAEKMEQYAIVRGNCLALAGAIDEEIKRLTKRKGALIHNAETLTDTMETAMIETGIRKIKTKLYTFGMRKAPVSLDKIVEKNVPAEFWVQHDPTIDKRALLAAVKADPERFKDIATTKQTEYIHIS